MSEVPTGTHQEPGNGDLFGELGKVVDRVSARIAEEARSENPTVRARALRTTLALLDNQLSASHGEPFRTGEQDTNREIDRLPFSGEEATDMLEEVLEGVDNDLATKVREHYGLAEVSGGASTQSSETQPQPSGGHEGDFKQWEAEVQGGAQSPETDVRPEEEGFTPEEGRVAALVIAACLEGAKIATDTKRTVSLKTLWSGEQTRAQIEAAVLADPHLAPGTRSEQRALVERVYQKLPRLMRKAYDRQRKLART